MFFIVHSTCKSHSLSELIVNVSTEILIVRRKENFPHDSCSICPLESFQKMLLLRFCSSPIKCSLSGRIKLYYIFSDSRLFWRFRFLIILVRFQLPFNLRDCLIELRTSCWVDITRFVGGNYEWLHLIPCAAIVKDSFSCEELSMITLYCA